jgi:sec-independent protein translocase protein TatC
VEKTVELPPKARIVSNLSNETHQYRLLPGENLIYEETITSPLLVMGPIEGLILVFKCCFWLSLAGTAPIWGWIWLQFILPGVKSHEKTLILPFLFCSLLCLVLGVLMAYYITLPIANQYLTLFNAAIGQNAWTLAHYVNYVLFLCLGHAIASELAFLLLLLVHFRLLSPEWLISKRRYMIVLAFVLGALLTPPDVLTQILMAIPLIGIYEFAILYAKFRSKRQEIILP